MNTDMHATIKECFLEALKKTLPHYSNVERRKKFIAELISAINYPNYYLLDNTDLLKEGLGDLITNEELLNFVFNFTTNFKLILLFNEIPWDTVITSLYTSLMLISNSNDQKNMVLDTDTLSLMDSANKNFWKDTLNNEHWLAGTLMLSFFLTEEIKVNG